METAISLIAILIATASWFEARRSRLIAEKARKVSFRTELQKIRIRWRDDIAPALVAHGGGLTNDEDLTFGKLLSDTKVMSHRIYAAMRRAYELSGDLTAIKATTDGQWPPLPEVVQTQSKKFAALRTAMDEVFDAIETELKAQL